MKIKYLFALIILISNINENFCQKNNGIVTYSTYKNNVGVEENKQTTEKLKLFNNKIEKEIKKLELSLVFSGNESSFSCIEPIHLNNDDKRIHFIARIFQKVYASFYVNKTQYIEEKDLGGEVFLIKRNIDISDWKLINEKKKIGNYICYKAVRDYSFITASNTVKINKQIVWYTLDIPIGYGPKNFVGFPGLVLKVEDGNLVYEAQKIVLNLKNGVKLKKPAKGNEISQEEYDKILGKSSVTIQREIKKRKKS